MGSVLSLIVQNVLYYLPGSFRSKAYKQIESNKNQNSECRSANEKFKARSNRLCKSYLKNQQTSIKILIN